MEDLARFQVQNLSSEDYKKTELGAKVIKDGFFVSLLVGFVFLEKKYGKTLIKNFSKVFKA